MHSLLKFTMALLFMTAVVSGALMQKPVWVALLALSKNEHFYIPHEWHLKSLQAQTTTQQGIIFAGTSRSASGIDPRLFTETSFNYALTGSSVSQFLKLTDSATLHGEVEAVLIELNPVAFSSHFIQASEQYDYSALLEEKKREWDGVGFLRYRPLLASIMVDALEVFSHEQPPQVGKFAYYFEHFEQVEKTSNRGYLPLRPLPVGLLQETLFKECAATTSWALRNADVERGLSILADYYRRWAQRGINVVAWIPPVHEKFLNPDYVKLQTSLEHGVKQLGIKTLDVADKQSQQAAYFNDCVHLNVTGANHVSRKLQTLLLESENL